MTIAVGTIAGVVTAAALIAVVMFCDVANSTVTSKS